MRTLPFVAAVVFVLAAFVPLMADDEGYQPMFNGKDLTGWVNVNCAPSTFFVRDGEIITTGKPTGYLRTEKQYENFIAEFDWMHINKTEVGNSGFFVWADPLPAVGTPYTRGIEVQVLVNLHKEGYYTSQGDLFSIWGAHCKPDRPHPHGWERCLPSENRTKGGGEWNHYKIIGNNGVLKLHVNGKEVSGLSQCTPRKGYLALESEGAECHFKNLKIKELPSTNPTAEDTADVAQGFHQLYTGLDLSGWQGDDNAKKHWKPRDWVLHYDGKGGALRTSKDHGDSEFVFDFHFPKGASKSCKLELRGGKGGEVKVELLLSRGVAGLRFTDLNGGELGGGAQSTYTVQPWNRARVVVEGERIEMTVNNAGRIGVQEPRMSKTGPLVLQPESEMDFGNLFARELKK
jgi:Domain of Unknown Function (DUF1080)